MLKGKNKKLIKIFTFNLITCILIFIFSFKELKGEIIWRCLVSFIFFYCIYKGIEEKKIINPYLLFLLTPLSLMIYSQSVSNYFLLELRSDTWFLAIINMIAFLIGINIILKKVIRIGNYSICQGKNFIIDEKRKNYCMHGILLFVLGQITKLCSIIGIALPGGEIFSVCQFLGIAVVYKSRKKILSYLMAIIYLILSIMTHFSKTTFLLLLMTFLVCIDSEIYSKQKRKKLYLCIIFGSLIMIFIVFPLKDFLSRGESIFKFINSNKDDLANYFLDRVQWNWNIKLLMPYIYMTTNWTNLQYILDTVTNYTHGLWFIKPLLGYLQVIDDMEIYSMLTPYRSAFNTYSFIAVQYVDFGFFGSTLSSLFLGIFSGIIYKRYKKNPDSFNCACYALTAVSIFEMFFSNHFFSQSYPFTIVIVAWILVKTIMKINIKIM